jgi:polyphosphate:AMP phosphotransferase
MLADDGMLIIKFWMHLSRKAQKKRLKTLEQDPLQSWQVTDTDWKHWKLYDKFIEAAEILISSTNTGHAKWHIVEGEDLYYRSLRVGKIVQKAIAKHLEASQLEARFQQENPANNESETAESGEYRSLTILDAVSTSEDLGREDYRAAMDQHIATLNLLHRKALDQGLSTVLVFEGPDASGKGGVIRRMSRALDAVNYSVIPYGAPTAEEARYHYLWRFWHYLRGSGRITIFDRSWYGRVLVERVEGFATEPEWSRAYGEINSFESQLVEHGMLLLKFWLHITKEEQLRRFKAREETPHKRWKLTEEDWRNRNRWDDYSHAAHDMIQKTSTAVAPWHIIEGNNKLYARVKVIGTVCEALETALKS